MKRILAFVGAFCAAVLAGCASEPTSAHTRTERTERVLESQIVDPARPPAPAKPAEPPETTTTRKSREERVIEEGPVVQ